MAPRPELAPEFLPNASEGLQVIPNGVTNGGGVTSPYYNHSLNAYTPYPTCTKRICGLRPATFWLTTIILVLVIAGAIGGGVGGSIARNSCLQAQGQNQTPASQRHVSVKSFAKTSNLTLYISFI